MARLKASVAQIRSQCTTDLRRRDTEISRMKRHLEGRRGRDGTSNQVGVVVVTPGLNKGAHRAEETDADLDSPEYSLKQETTEFLTQLSQGLSDENDALIGLVRGTLATLRSLQGLPADEAREVDLGGFEGTYNEQGVMTGLPSYEALATSTDEVLEHLRGLLTNPSFVPLEEVEIREDEIHRLREGWEMMAVRWKEAVALMGGWKKRMMDEGDTIKLEDLRVGLNLGSGLPSAQDARNSPFKSREAKLDSNDPTEPEEMQEEQDNMPVDDEVAEMMADNAGVDTPKGTAVLGERNENARLLPSPQKEALQASSENQFNEDDFSLLDFSMNQGCPASPPKPKSRIPLQVCLRVPH